MLNLTIIVDFSLYIPKTIMLIHFLQPDTFMMYTFLERILLKFLDVCDPLKQCHKI